jgi:signal transduction histidine kinase
MAHFAPAALPWLLKIGYTGIVFIPAVCYHFIAEFTQGENGLPLSWTYFVAAILAVLVWLGHTLIHDAIRYSWGISGRAGILYPLFVCFITFVVVRMFILLHRAREEAGISPLKRFQIGWVMLALAIYSLGATDLLSNYGVSLFPISWLFTGVALGLFSYAILRHELLAINTPSETDAERTRRVAASEEMARLGMAAAFPLVSQGEILGYLMLGEKLSEESYSKEDLLLLRIVSNQAALAYQRVRYLEMAMRGARTEMLGEIAGGFAHEIKTPLANISLPAELCFLDLTDIETGKRKIEDLLPELKQRMKDIMQQAFKASDKIEAIRQFSKPGQVQLEPVDIRKILQNSMTLLDHTVRKLGITLQADLAGSLPLIRGNAKQLEIVFVNLIKNGSEAMASLGAAVTSKKLTISCREQNSTVSISVKDSGPGIKRTDIGHLFEAYFTTKGSSGTGMGLFLSHQVIKAHGGSIEVRSEEGKGTEFIVRLPKFTADKAAGVQAA